MNKLEDKKDNSQELTNVVLSQFELQYRLREERTRGEKAGYRKGVILTLLTSIAASVILNKGGINVVDKIDKLVDSTIKGTKHFVKNTKTALNAKTNKIKNTSKW